MFEHIQLFREYLKTTTDDIVERNNLPDTRRPGNESSLNARKTKAM